MSLVRFVGTNQEFGEWLKICSRIGVFIAHLHDRQITVPVGCTLTWTQDHKVGLQLVS
ncbi:MAG TPA: hypothetical protein VN426_09075 [Syntrophomonadaceae bacterium]|nr:hypothetical protein [Syntrophomonadaceae bacterium]